MSTCTTSLARKLQNLLADIEDTRIPTHSDYGGISVAIEDANDELAAGGFKTIPVTWRDIDTEFRNSAKVDETPVVLLLSEIERSTILKALQAFDLSRPQGAAFHALVSRIEGA